MVKKEKKKLTQKRIDDLGSIYSALKDIVLFSDLTQDELWDFCFIVEIHHYKEGKIIAKEGDINSRLYVINDGVIEISKTTALGETYVISLIDAKNSNAASFGEVSLVDDHPRTATIIAKSDLTVYSLSGNLFTKFCDKNTDIGYRIMKQLVHSTCKYLRSSNNNVITLFNALVEETQRGIGN